MNLLFLSDDILLTILSDWLTSFDVCRWDTALCCQKSRNYFLELFLNKESMLLLEEETSANSKTQQSYVDYWNWLKMRNLSLKSMTIDGFVVSRSLVSNFERIAQNIETLQVSSSVKLELAELNSPFLSNNTLKHLHFITDDSLAFCEKFIRLVEFSHILSLKLHVLKVTDNLLCTVAKSFKKLVNFELCMCNLVTDDGLVKILKSCPLEFIRVVRCSQITHHSVHYAVNHCLKLKSFYSDVKGDVPLWDFILSFPHLSVLSLSGGSHESVSCHSLNRILALKSELCLTKLCLFGSRQEHTAHLAHVLSKCKLLSSFSLSKSVVSDDIVHHLRSKCNSFKQLLFNNCSLLCSVELFRSFLERCSALDNFVLSNATFVTDSFIAPIVNSLQCASSLYLDVTLISDITLDAIVALKIPFDFFTLNNCPNVTSDGIKRLALSDNGGCFRFISVPADAFLNQEELKTTLKSECKAINTHIQYE